MRSSGFSSVSRSLPAIAPRSMRSDGSWDESVRSTGARDLALYAPRSLMAHRSTRHAVGLSLLLVGCLRPSPPPAGGPIARREGLGRGLCAGSAGGPPEVSGLRRPELGLRELLWFVRVSVGHLPSARVGASRENDVAREGWADVPAREGSSDARSDRRAVARIGAERRWSDARGERRPRTGPRWCTRTIARRANRASASRFSTASMRSTVTTTFAAR